MNECNLTKRIVTPQGQRYCRVVLSANGRVKPDMVYVGENIEKHEEGAYYIEWREGGKRVRLAVGKDAADANAQRLKKEWELNASQHGIVVAPEAKDERRSLASAVADYLADVAKNHKPKSLAAYTTALEYFLESCSKQTVEDVDRTDMLDFAEFLRDEKELGARTTYNKFLQTMIFLKAVGVRGLVKKNDWPQYTKEEPTIYEDDELTKLFAACDAEEKLWFEFFLNTGFRDQEARYVCWSNVNFTASTISVTHKPEWHWTPKAYKERSVPVSDGMMEALKAWKAKADKKCPLVFPTGKCNPKTDFLECLKHVAAKAGVEDCYLHKFRATFATKCLWGGVDVRTLMNWLGHSDMESTLRYLKPNRSAEVRAKVNSIFVSANAQQ
jgi:integrase